MVKMKTIGNKLVSYPIFVGTRSLKLLSRDIWSIHIGLTWNKPLSVGIYDQRTARVDTIELVYTEHGRRAWFVRFTRCWLLTVSDNQRTEHSLSMLGLTCWCNLKLNFWDELFLTLWPGYAHWPLTMTDLSPHSCCELWRRTERQVQPAWRGPHRSPFIQDVPFPPYVIRFCVTQKLTAGSRKTFIDQFGNHSDNSTLVVKHVQC